MSIEEAHLAMIAQIREQGDAEAFLVLAPSPTDQIPGISDRPARPDRDGPSHPERPGGRESRHRGAGDVHGGFGILAALGGEVALECERGEAVRE